MKLILFCYWISLTIFLVSREPWKLFTILEEAETVLQPHNPTISFFLHAASYCILALLIYASRFTNSKTAARLIVLAMIHGVVMEFAQMLVPPREPNFWDVIANWAGIGIVAFGVSVRKRRLQSL